MKVYNFCGPLLFYIMYSNQAEHKIIISIISNIITHDCHSQQENLFYRILSEQSPMQHLYVKSMKTNIKTVKNTVGKKKICIYTLNRSILLYSRFKYFSLEFLQIIFKILNFYVIAVNVEST